MSHDDYLASVIDMIIDEKPLDFVLDYIGSMIKSTIVLTDEDFRLIGCGNMKLLSSGDESDINKNATAFDSETVDNINRLLLESPDGPVCISCRFHHRDEDFKIYPMKKDGKAVAYLFAGFDAMSELDDVLLARTADILRLEVTRHNLEMKNSVNSKTDFVTHVLLENITDQKELIALCNINGFDYSLGRVCIFIRLPRNRETDDHAQRTINVKVNSVISSLCHYNLLLLLPYNYSIQYFSL